MTDEAATRPYEVVAMICQTSGINHSNHTKEQQHVCIANPLPEVSCLLCIVQQDCTSVLKVPLSNNYICGELKNELSSADVVIMTTVYHVPHTRTSGLVLANPRTIYLETATGDIDDIS